MVDNTPHRGKIVLLSDPSWTQLHGVCCWRASVHAAFTAHGLDVYELPWSPPVMTETPPATAPAARPPSVPRTVLRAGKRVGWAIGYGAFRLGRRISRPVVRPIATAVKRRRVKVLPNGDGDRLPATRPETDPIDPRLAALADCALLIAESPAAALAAVNSGVPRSLVWLFAIPAERAVAGEPASWAAPLRDAAPLLGGLIADDLDAAGILERVAGPVKTTVFPPITSVCIDCADTEAESPADLDLYPTDIPGHLRLWRALLAEKTPAPLPYSYAVARFRGEEGPWLPAERPSWTSPDGSVRPKPIPPLPAAAVQHRRIALADLARPGSANSESPLRVRVFGHDMKFMRDLAETLDERAGLDVVVDEWRSAGVKNDGITENLSRSAQVLVAEWARPNAIWLSETKRPDQRLIVRLHRFEIESAYPKSIRIDRVESVVHIAPHMGPRIVDELGWPEEKLVYIPNYADLARLDRPKLAGTNFTLGMLGIVPGLKRFDLALDLLSDVRKNDPRFSLLVRGQNGWAHKPSWEKPSERREFQRCMERVEKDPLLRGAVTFDAFGRDVAAWFRKVGHVLSLSDLEGSHAALAEGMGSGAVPVLRGWTGAVEAYGSSWLCDSLEDATAFVLENADPEVWAARSAAAKADANRLFDQQKVLAAWDDLIRGDLDAARLHFG